MVFEHISCYAPLMRTSLSALSFLPGDVLEFLKMNPSVSVLHTFSDEATPVYQVSVGRFTRIPSHQECLNQEELVVALHVVMKMEGC